MQTISLDVHMGKVLNAISKTDGVLYRSKKVGDSSIWLEEDQVDRYL